MSYQLTGTRGRGTAVWNAASEFFRAEQQTEQHIKLCYDGANVSFLFRNPTDVDGVAGPITARFEATVRINGTLYNLDFGAGAAFKVLNMGEQVWATVAGGLDLAAGIHTCVIYTFFQSGADTHTLKNQAFQKSNGDRWEIANLGGLVKKIDGSGQIGNETLEDLSHGGVFTGAGCTAVRVDRVGALRPSAALNGDSRVVQFSTTLLSDVAEAMEYSDIPFVVAGIVGSGLGSYVAARLAPYNLELEAMVETLVFEYGINDFNSAPTEANGIAYYGTVEAICTTLAAEGKKSVWYTPLPYITFDAGTDHALANQNVTPGNVARVAYLTLLRANHGTAALPSTVGPVWEATGGSPLQTGYEHEKDSGLLRPDLGVIMGDGLHQGGALSIIGAARAPFKTMFTNGLDPLGPALILASVPAAGDRITLLMLEQYGMGTPLSGLGVTITSGGVSVPVAAVTWEETYEGSKEYFVTLYPATRIVQAVTTTVTIAEVNGIVDEAGNPAVPVTTFAVTNGSTTPAYAPPTETLIDDPFDGTVALAAAPGNIGNGWLDPVGNKASKDGGILTILNNGRLHNPVNKKYGTFAVDFVPSDVAAGFDFALGLGTAADGTGGLWLLAYCPAGGANWLLGISTDGTFGGLQGGSQEFAPPALGSTYRCTLILSPAGANTGVLVQFYNVTAATMLRTVQKDMATAHVLGDAVIKPGAAIGMAEVRFRSANLVATADDAVGPGFASAETDTTGQVVLITTDELISTPLVPATGMTGHTVSGKTVVSAARWYDNRIAVTLDDPIYLGESANSTLAGENNLTDSASPANVSPGWGASAITNNSLAVASIGGSADNEGPLRDQVINAVATDPLRTAIAAGQFGNVAFLGGDNYLIYGVGNGGAIAIARCITLASGALQLVDLRPIGNTPVPSGGSGPSAALRALVQAALAADSFRANLLAGTFGTVVDNDNSTITIFATDNRTPIAVMRYVTDIAGGLVMVDYRRF